MNVYCNCSSFQEVIPSESLAYKNCRRVANMATQEQCLCLVYVDGREARGTQKLQFIVASAGVVPF